MYTSITYSYIQYNEHFLHVPVYEMSETTYYVVFLKNSPNPITCTQISEKIVHLLVTFWCIFFSMLLSRIFEFVCVCLLTGNLFSDENKLIWPLLHNSIYVDVRMYKTQVLCNKVMFGHRC